MADEYYVNILDSDLPNSTDWEYVIKRNTLPEIEKANIIEIDESQGKQDYDGTFIHKKNISNSTGALVSGNIYKLTKRRS